MRLTHEAQVMPSIGSAISSGSVVGDGRLDILPGSIPARSRGPGALRQTWPMPAADGHAIADDRRAVGPAPLAATTAASWRSSRLTTDEAFATDASPSALRLGRAELRCAGRRSAADPPGPRRGGRRSSLVAGRPPRRRCRRSTSTDRPDWDRRVLGGGPGDRRGARRRATARSPDGSVRRGRLGRSAARSGATRSACWCPVPSGHRGGRHDRRLRRRCLGSREAAARAQARVAAPRGRSTWRDASRRLGARHRAHRVDADDDRRARVERELVADLAAAQQLAEQLALALRQADVDAARIDAGPG